MTNKAEVTLETREMIVAYHRIGKSDWAKLQVNWKYSANCYNYNVNIFKSTDNQKSETFALKVYCSGSKQTGH